MELNCVSNQAKVTQWDSPRKSNPTSPAKRGSLELTKTVNSLEVLENQAVFSLSNIPDRPGIAAQIFEKLSEASIK